MIRSMMTKVCCQDNIVGDAVFIIDRTKLPGVAISSTVAVVFQHQPNSISRKKNGLLRLPDWFPLDKVYWSIMRGNVDPILIRPN